MNQALQNILLIEDITSLAVVYIDQLQSAGYVVDHAATAAEARARIETQDYAAVLVDLGLPDGDGLSLMDRLKKQPSKPVILIITADASIQMAIIAMREGAYDYLIKPLSKDKLVSTLKRAFAARKVMVTNVPDEPVNHTRSQNAPKPVFGGFDGVSRKMCEVYERIKSAAPSRASVFITGESGTGKELCAEAIHRHSACKSGPFVALNCGAIPHDLMESEIFGHVKGAFTGALNDRTGAARLAHHGTLFLDEICEMDFSLQTKLLRFLQTGLVQPVGTTEPEKVDVRIICATNKEPQDEVKEGRLREDLYFRLFVLPIHLPPLRERGADTINLINLFLKQYAEEENAPAQRFSEAALTALGRYLWPGNVRELQNVVRHVVVLNHFKTIDLEMLPETILRAQDVSGAEPCELDVSGLHEPVRQHQSQFIGKPLWQIEKDAIETTINACGGSIPQAARMLGVSPSTIYRKRDAWQQRV